jgi:hypothetical protein
MSTESPNLETLLSDPSVTLIDIISSPTFSIESRSGNSDLFRFLFDPQTFQEILNTIFTSPSHHQFHNTLIDFLTSDSFAIQQALLNNSILSNFLSTFPTNPHCLNPKLAGIACRIIARLLKTSNGRYSLQLPTLVNFLTENLVNLPYRDLLEAIILASPTAVPRTSEFYQSLLNATSNKFYSLSLIRSLIKKSDEILSIIALPTVSRRLFEIASSQTELKYYSLLALEIITEMRGKVNFESLLNEFESAFEWIQNLNDCRLPILLSLFPRRIFQHIEDFLVSKTSTIYDEIVVEVFRKIDRELFVELVEKPEFLSRATEALGRSKVNGHLGNFLKVLNERRNLSVSLQNSEWAEFSESTLAQHLERMRAPYGVVEVRRSACNLERVLPSDSEERSSSSGSASDDDMGETSKVVFTPPIGIVSNFDFVACESVPTLTEPVNVIEIPSLGADTISPERRSRRRNVGSVSLADFPHSFEAPSC